MTFEDLQKAWQAPAVFLFGNDASSKQAFAQWCETAARKAGGNVLREKPAFIKNFCPWVQQGLFGEPQTLLLLEGVTDASLPSLEPFLDSFQPQGRALIFLSPEAKKIPTHFAQHTSYPSCGFFKNPRHRQALVQFFFSLQGESMPDLPEALFTSREMEEQCAGTCQKLWLLHTEEAFLQRFCSEATQPERWDVQALRSLEPVAATRLLLARTLKTLTKAEPVLSFSSRPQSRAALLQMLLDHEISFKRRQTLPKSALFQSFLT
ncbi:MAG: hypothetical protein LBJ70_01855 [Holosporales bacterium]|jgi:hypothetical protein|nr:hypothetical protein [Holosporales bacterium]